MWPLPPHTPPTFTTTAWSLASEGQEVLKHLKPDEQSRLWTLAHNFIRTRSIIPAGGLKLDDIKCLRIALLACLPILELDLGWYRGLNEIIVYPGVFAPERVWTDEYGIAHAGRESLSGEAWDQGLMLLSWDDIMAGGPLDGRHVVLHECAHWLDFQNGAANGRPPLHSDMDPEDWTTHFSTAYAHFCAAPHHSCSALSPYAATSPAEFFAVCCELFFERPLALRQCWTNIHRLLRAFFRQTPEVRFSMASGTRS